ncbi:MAG: hypothetical protein ABIP06_07975 [Pyrinomonadaceae bacterium]
MKKMIFLFSVLLAFGGKLHAQIAPGVPNGSIAKDSRDEYDNGIRLRSIELEKIKNQSHRSAAAQETFEKRRLNYSQIKKDFEAVQKLQNQIVKTYITGKEIDYKHISALAAELNESAKRLEENLLLADEKSLKKSEQKNSAPEDIKDLIVILDKFVGNFVTSPVFVNLEIIEPKVAGKTESDLQNIIRLSSLLAQNAGK